MAELAPQDDRTLADRWWRVKRRLARTVHLDLARDPARTVFLAGSGRSGTTWLAEVVNHDNAFRYLFEPLHPDERGVGGSLGPRRYARPGDRDPAVVRAVEAVVTGRVRDPWTDQYNRRLVATRRLVKEVWQNLLLGWLRQEYPNVRIVLVLRHPCAVADSQMQTGWDWRPGPGSFLSQPDLMADHLELHRDLLLRTEDPFDRHVLTWCVENAVPLRQLAPGQAHVAFYEHIRSGPERELPDVFASCGRPWKPSVLDRVARPSALARREGALAPGETRVDGWLSTVSADRVARAAVTLAAFGLDRLYDATDPTPRMPGRDVLAAFSTA